MKAEHKNWFVASGCLSLEYRFSSALDKFKFDQFAADLKERGADRALKEGGITFVAPTRNPKRTDYHVHVSCDWDRKMFRASLEYVRGSTKPGAQEKRPFAEELMEWLGDFFKNERVTAGVDGSFEYSRKKNEPTVPIPMRLRLSSRREIEIVGTVIEVPYRPHGLYSAFVAVYSDDLTVSVNTQRAITFRTFRIHPDLTAMSECARMFVRESAR